MRQLRTIINNVLGHLETRKLGLIVEGLRLRLRLRGGDGERDLEVRRRSLVLQCVGCLGEVESDGGEWS